MKKGSHQTEEAKKRISEKISKIRKEYNPMTGRTGELHPNFGKHWSEEVRKKMSASHKGKPSTFKGKYHTEEAKRKNSEAHLGKVAWNKGLETGNLSENHKQNISSGVLDWWKNASDDIISERNRKIAESKIESISPNTVGCYYINTDNKNIWLRSSYEVRIASILDKYHIKWTYESSYFKLGNHYYHPDFYLTDYDLWWEVKGWFTDANKEKMKKFSELYPDVKLKMIFNDDIKYLERNTTKENSNDIILSIGKNIEECT